MSDALTMSGRCLRLSRRNPEALLTSLMLPVMLMLLFVYLFGGAIETGTRYVTYVVPGPAAAVRRLRRFDHGRQASANDMRGGIVDRLRSLDVGGAAFLAGHVTASVARNAASTTLVLAVGAADRLPARRRCARVGRRRRRPAGRSCSPCRGSRAVIGLLAKSPEGGQRLHVLRDVPALPEQRVRPGGHDAVVDPGLRRAPAGHAGGSRRSAALLLGTPAGSSPWQALAWCAALLTVSITLAGVLPPAPDAVILRASVDARCVDVIQRSENGCASRLRPTRTSPRSPTSQRAGAARPSCTGSRCGAESAAVGPARIRAAC